MYKLTSLILTLVVAGPVTAAAKKFDPEARAKTIAPFLDEEVIGLARLDVTRLDPDAIFDKLAEVGKVPAKEFNQPNKGLLQAKTAFTKAGGKEIYFVVSLADVVLGNAPGGFVIIPLGEDADADALAKIAGTGFEVGAKVRGKKAIFGGSKAAWKRLESLQADARPDLAKAFAAAGDTAAQLLVLPTKDNRRVIDEVMPVLPRQIGGGSSKIITHGLRWAALGIDPPPKMSLRLVIHSKDADAAKSLHGLISRIFKAVGRGEDVQKWLPEYAKITAQLTPLVEKDRLALKLDDDQLVQMAQALQPAIARVRGAADQARSMNNLRQIGIAMHNYYDTHKAFPTAAIYSKKGKPLLSWRVTILPYIEQDALYKQFHLEEPWDSPHNKKLIAQVPPVYRSGNPKLAAAGKSLYLAPLGKDTMFPGRQAIKIADVTDGTSNTIFIVEAAEDRAVIWTKPDDLKYDPKKPLAGLVGKGKTGFLALFVDASVRFLPAKIDAKNLHAMFTRNGGESIVEP